MMTKALSNQATHAHTPEVSKLLSTMKNIGSHKYKGGSDPIEADKWITMMEKNFEAMECPEEYKKKIAVLSGRRRNRMVGQHRKAAWTYHHIMGIIQGRVREEVLSS